jgi:O-antigen/teichoic acid export membrane protein
VTSTPEGTDATSGAIAAGVDVGVEDDRDAGSAPESTDGLTLGDVRRRAFSGSILLAGKGIVVQAIGFVSTIVIAHYLTPDELGQVAFGVTLTTLLAFVGGSQGLAGALIRMQKTPEPEDLQTVLGLQLAIGLSIAFVVSVVALPFGTVGDLTILMVWAIPVTAFRVPAQTVLERSLSYRRLVTAETTEVILFQGWQIATVLAGWGVWGLASAFLFRAVAGTTVLVAVSHVRHLRPRFSRMRARRLFGIGVRIQATDLIDSLRDQGMNIAAAAIGGLPVLGLWSMAYRAIQFPAMVFTSLFRVSLPAMSRALTLGKDPRPLIEDAVAFVAPSFGVVLVPLAASSPALFPAILGDRWAGAAGALPPACLGFMVLGPVAIAGVGYLWAIGDGNVPLRGAIYNSIAWFACSLPLLPFLGATAVGVGMCAAFIVQTVTVIRGVRRHVEVAIGSYLLVPTALAVVATIPAWVLASSVEPTLEIVLATAFAAETIYLAALFVFHRKVTRRLAGAVIGPVLGRRRVRLAGAAAGS